MGSRRNRTILAMVVSTVIVGLLAISTANAAPKNRSPILAFSPSQHQSVSVGTVATIDVSGTYDPEGDAISFDWSSADRPPAAFEQVSPTMIRFTPPAAAKYVFKVTARDSNGGKMVRYASVWGTEAEEASTTTTTTAPASNGSPMLVFTPDQHQTADVGTVAVIDASRSYDPDGDPLTWSWSQADGPTTTFTRVSDSVIQFPVAEATKYVFKVTATDPLGANMVRYASVTGSSTSTTDSTSSTSTAPASTSDPAPAGSTTDSNVLWSGTFDTSDPYAGWGASSVHRSDNMRVVTPPVAIDGGTSGRAWKVDYNAQPSGAYVGDGAAIMSDFTKTTVGMQEEVYLRYHLYVPSNHHWFYGGKLPGLAGALPGTTPPWGGEYTDSGWSGRLLFLGENYSPYGSSYNPAGRLASYLYVKHANGTYIENNVNPSNGRMYGITVSFKDATGKQMSIPKGQWSTIELRYKMNTPGKNDGVFEGWLNGVKGISLSDVQYRTGSSPDLKIDRLAMGTFYGGPYANTTAQTAYFDNVILSTGRVSNP